MRSSPYALPAFIGIEALAKLVDLVERKALGDQNSGKGESQPNVLGAHFDARRAIAVAAHQMGNSAARMRYVMMLHLRCCVAALSSASRAASEEIDPVSRAPELEWVPDAKGLTSGSAAWVGRAATDWEIAATEAGRRQASVTFSALEKPRAESGFALERGFQCVGPTDFLPSAFTSQQTPSVQSSGGSWSSTKNQPPHL